MTIERHHFLSNRIKPKGFVIVVRTYDLQRFSILARVCKIMKKISKGKGMTKKLWSLNKGGPKLTDEVDQSEIQDVDSSDFLPPVMEKESKKIRKDKNGQKSVRKKKNSKEPSLETVENGGHMENEEEATGFTVGNDDIEVEGDAVNTGMDLEDEEDIGGGKERGAKKPPVIVRSLKASWESMPVYTGGPLYFTEDEDKIVALCNNAIIVYDINTNTVIHSISHVNRHLHVPLTNERIT